jgi:hydrogenase maturation protease
MSGPAIVCFGQRGAGDDAVGLCVAQQLAREGVAARTSGDATLLLDLLAQGQRVIVVDAVVCTQPQERSVLHLRPAALASAGVSPVSCHGLGVAEALALAEVLYGASASDVDIVAIPIARPLRAIEQLSAAAQAAVPQACALVHELLRSHGE